MSDSATNTGSDDVLSSIRRLVSDTQLHQLGDDQDDAPNAAEAGEQLGSGPQAGKLLLTPSLRVAESSELSQDEVSQNNSADRPEPLLLTDPMAPWQDPEATLYATSAEVGASESADTEAGFVHLDDDDMSVPEERSNVVPLVLKREQMADTSDLHQEFIFGTVRDKDALPHEPVRDETADSPLQARLGAVEAALETSHEAYEPEEADDGDYAGTSTAELDWSEEGAEPQSEPHPEPRAEAEPEAAPVLDADPSEVVPQEADELENLLQEPEPVAALDEAALEEMVTEIVRRELQGVLGERITRNVRKMVRREIQRALALQEFE